MIWISTEDVIAIHSRVIQITGGMEGIRDYASLEAAIAAPLQSFGGQDLFLEDIDKIARIDMALLQIMPSSTEIRHWSNGGAAAAQVEWIHDIASGRRTGRYFYCDCGWYNERKGVI